MQQRHPVNWIAAALLASVRILFADDVPKPLAPPDLVFDEAGGIVSVEAEHFHKQTLTDKRAWHITSSKSAPDIKPDADPADVQDASGSAYLEIPPDTRSTHDDIQGGNGHLVLSIAGARNKQGEPLTSGQIQIQSKAAEHYDCKMRVSPIKTFPEDLAAMAGLAVTGGIAPTQPIGSVQPTPH